MRSSHVSVATGADKRSVYVVTEHLGRMVPVGELSFSNGRYVFGYTCGALHLGARTHVVPLPGLPNLTQRYQSKTLFPVFLAALDLHRADDLRAALRARRLDLDAADFLSMLAVPTRLHTPQMLVTVPSLRGDHEGAFRCRFFTPGPARSAPPIGALTVGQLLRVNLVQADGGKRRRVEIVTANGEFIDWLPEFLVAELVPVWRSGLSLRVELLANESHATARDERLLIELSGRWPDGYTPMQLLVFSPIVI
ncbi:MAG: hypothetical protein KDI32_09060 [Pseudomonadales bacterium]|jgi:hypothetical protein|nr:hypothetical protein [Pseudomonadales bacterium]